MANPYMPKTFHDPHKNPLASPPTYLMYCPLLTMNEEAKKVFLPRPVVSFKSTCKISSYQVRSKLYPSDKVVESTKCGKKRSEICLSVSKTDAFTSNLTGETYKVNLQLNCGDN